MAQGAGAIVLAVRVLQDDGVELATAIPTLLKAAEASGARIGAHNPGTKTGTFRLGTDVLITDTDGNADISGADFAIAFADEIDKPAHHQARFTMGY